MKLKERNTAGLYLKIDYTKNGMIFSELKNKSPA